jgi:hypothetical protein
VVDKSKTYQQAYGFAYTNSARYFLLIYAGLAKASREKPAAASGENPSKGAPQAAAVPELFVEVVDTKAQPVFLSATAFQPVIGQPDLSEHRAVRGPATHRRSSLRTNRRAEGGDPVPGHCRASRERLAAHRPCARGSRGREAAPDEIGNGSAKQVEAKAALRLA